MMLMMAICFMCISNILLYCIWVNIIIAVENQDWE